MSKIQAAFLIALGVVLLFAISSIEAGGCANYSYAQRSYSYQPAYYQQAYVAPTYVTEYKEVLKPYAVRAVLSPDYYYSSADHYREQTAATREQLVADAAAYRALTLLMNSGLAGGNLQQQGVRPGAYIPAPGERQSQQQAVNPGARGTNPGARASGQPGGGGGVPPGLQELVEAKCARCHAGQKPDRLDLTNLEAVSRVDRYDSWMQTHEGSMPQGSQPLTDTEVKLFRDWTKAARR